MWKAKNTIWDDNINRQGFLEQQATLLMNIIIKLYSQNCLPCLVQIICIVCHILYYTEHSVQITQFLKSITARRVKLSQKSYEHGRGSSPFDLFVVSTDLGCASQIFM